MLIVNRDEHKSNYTCISNAVIFDNRLSFSARGFFYVVLSLSEKWDFTTEGIAKLTGINKDSALRYMKELEALGYLRRTVSRDEKGRFSKKSFVFFENPSTEKPSP